MSDEDVATLVQRKLDESRARAEEMRLSAEDSISRAEGSHPETLAQLATDAREAWESGQNHYLPLISAYARAVDDGIIRSRGAEKALDVIAAQGWQLHTWTWGEAGPMGILAARPLFVRPRT
ncbi:hypothetical protein ACNKF0_10505 [Nocardioides sp. T5]|uniref:hypothetical protein n=1 Tax=Nocardioides sp. T5 TaxID=3400182 RepID=UPI003A860F2F